MTVWEFMTGLRRRAKRWVVRSWPGGQRVVTSPTFDAYLVAYLIAVAVLVIRSLFSVWVPVGYVIVPLVFAVSLASSLLGFGPSMLTLVVASLGARLLFMGPRWSLSVNGFENQVSLTCSVLGCVLVAGLFERMRALMRSLEAQRELLRALIDVQEKEKQHLCNEFHDGLVQYAVGARMLLEGELSDSSGSINAGVVEVVVDYLRRGIDDGRRALRGIRPAVLDDGDLNEAIADLADQFCCGGIAVRSSCEASVGRVSELVKTTVYRVVQEALSNVRKHSGSGTAAVSLAREQETLLVEIVDGGRGFDPGEARRQGFGLRGVAERVRLVGGTCTIESRPGKGTRLSIRIPLGAPASPEVSDGLAAGLARAEARGSAPAR